MAASPARLALERAAELSNWGRWKDALDECKGALRNAPDDPDARAVQTWLLAVIGKGNEEELKKQAQWLSEDHPRLSTPAVAHASVAFAFGGGFELMASEMLIQQLPSFRGDPTIHASLGALLGQRGLYGAAWGQYRAALEAGGITSPGHRACAFRCARKSDDRDGSSRVLRGAGPVERVAMRLRPFRRWLGAGWFFITVIGLFAYDPALLMAASALALVLACVRFFVTGRETSILLFPILSTNAWLLYRYFDRATIGLVVGIGLVTGLRGATVLAEGNRASGGAVRRKQEPPAGPWPALLAPPMFPTGVQNIGSGHPRRWPARVRRQGRILVLAAALMAGLVVAVVPRR